MVFIAYQGKNKCLSWKLEYSLGLDLLNHNSIGCALGEDTGAGEGCVDVKLESFWRKEPQNTPAREREQFLVFYLLSHYHEV